MDQTRQHLFNNPVSEAFLNDRKNDEHECSAFEILPHNGDPHRFQPSHVRRLTASGRNHGVHRLSLGWSRYDLFLRGNCTLRYSIITLIDLGPEHTIFTEYGGPLAEVDTPL